jgi:hypothetical protein
VDSNVCAEIALLCKWLPTSLTNKWFLSSLLGHERSYVVSFVNSKSSDPWVFFPTTTAYMRLSTSMCYIMANQMSFGNKWLPTAFMLAHKWSLSCLFKH